MLTAVRNVYELCLNENILLWMRHYGILRFLLINISIKLHVTKLMIGSSYFGVV
jgi:hypothetical protein